MTYQQQIRLIAPLHDARHVEAYMRLEYSTLDGMSSQQFRAEVLHACKCIDADPKQAEALAQSFGL